MPGLGHSFTKHVRMCILTKILAAVELWDSNIGIWGDDKPLEEIFLRRCSYEMLLRVTNHLQGTLGNRPESMLSNCLQLLGRDRK